MILTSDSPCQVISTPDEGGGVLVEVRVPTYSGGVVFIIHAERSADGDWVVSLPSSEKLSDEPVIIQGDIEVLNGLAYLGAPDVEVEAKY